MVLLPVRKEFVINLKDVGRKVGHGVVVGGNSVLEADFVAPVKGVRSKVAGARQMRRDYKAAKAMSEQFADAVNPDVLASLGQAMQVFVEAQAR